MNRSPLFGYTHADSPVHRASPGVKLLTLLGFCILTAAAGPLLLAAASAMLVLFILLSGRQVPAALPGYWKIYIFFALTGLLRVLTTGSVTDGLFFSLRMLLMMLGGVVFYSTTRLTRLRRAVAPLPSGFTRIKQAVDIMIMALAFIPMIFRSAEELTEARYARCFGKSAHPLRTIRLTALPLMIDLFLKTEEAADAWYSRGYSAK